MKLIKLFVRLEILPPIRIRDLSPGALDRLRRDRTLEPFPLILANPLKEALGEHLTALLAFEEFREGPVEVGQDAIDVDCDFQSAPPVSTNT